MRRRGNHRGARPLLGFADERLDQEQEQREAERVHVDVGEDGLDLLAELLGHQLLQTGGDLADAGIALLAAHHAAVGHFRDLGQLRLALRAERGGHRPSLVVGAHPGHFAGLVDLGQRFRRAAADLHDVDRHFVASRRLRHADRIAFQILAVGDQQDHLAVFGGQRIPLQELAAGLERARDGGAADRHVVGRKLAEELGDRAAVAGDGKAHRLAGEGDGAETRARQLGDQARHLGLGSHACATGATSRAYMLFE